MQPDMAYEHASAPMPPPMMAMQSSDAVPHGGAGLSNQAVRDTVEQVGAIYGEQTAAAVAAAMDKRSADWTNMHGAHD